MSLLARWRKSLSLRVIVGSSFLILAVVIGFSSLLLNQVRTGVIESKVNDSLVDAVVGLDFALDVVDSFGPNLSSSSSLVDSIIATLSRRSGDPAAYEVLLLSNSGGPERSTNSVLPSSVPADLLVQVFETDSQRWTYSQINYVDGTSVPSVAVGAPLNLGEQQYGLFLLYPTTQQEELIRLVQSAIFFISLLLASSLIGIVVLITRRITNPIRAAADTAQNIAAGILDERLTVMGEDEVARWAQSFNAMTDTLEKQILKLEGLSVIQQRFVSDVSHELRTPVTTVRLAADLLHSKRDEFPPEVARAVELLQGELDRFEIMLADLLEISRMDAGASPLQLANHHLSDIVDRVIDSVSQVANSTGIELSPIYQRPSGFTSCDSRRLERAIRNLVTNAMAHSGSKKIDVVIEELDNSDLISVIDYGVGLTDEQKTQVFERFWRADPARSRDLGGSGLGLSIALEDVKQHDGNLNVLDNPAGSGVIFSIEIPRRVESSIL